MAMTIEELQVIITANNRDINEKFRQISQQAVSMDREIKSRAVNIGRSFRYIASTVMALGIGKIIKDSLSEAMNFEESESLFEVSMKQMADSARAWSEELQGSVGINAGEARMNAAVLYNMTTSMGVAEDSAYELSTGLTKLSYDIASFRNISNEEAFNKIRAGLTGETEPLKALGILVDENTVKQYAYATGIAASGTQLDNVQKVMARYQAILAQTGNDQGDLERTINSTTNQTRLLANNFTIMKRELGNAFLPLYQVGLPILNKVVSWVTALASRLKVVISYIAAFVSVLTGVKPAIGGVANSSETIADAYGSAASGAGDLADNTKKAGKEAKNALAPFDDLNILATNAGSAIDGAGAGGGAIGGDIGMPDFTGLDTEIKLPEVDTSSIEKFAYKVKETFRNVADFIDEHKSIILATLAGIMAGFAAFKIVGFIASIKSGAVAAGFLGKAFAGAIGIMGMVKNVGVAATLSSIAQTIPGVSTALALFGGSWLALGAVIGGVALAVGAATYAVIELNKPCIATKNIFKGVSQETMEATESFIEMSDTFQKRVKTLSWSDTIISEDIASELENQIHGMVDTIQNSLDSEVIDTTQMWEQAFLENDGIIDEHEQQTLEMIRAGYDNKMLEITDKEAQINQIIASAKAENRALTQEEENQILQIQSDMADQGITILSKNAEDTAIIRQRMKDNAQALSIEQASEIIKASLETKNETVKAAEERYDEEIRNAQRLKEAGIINQETYDEMTAAAKQNRDDTIKAAEDTHQGLVNEAKEQNPDIMKYVDEGTGEIKSRWSKMCDDVVEKISNWWENDIRPWFTIEKWKQLGENMVQGIKDKWNEFTAWWGNLGPVKWWRDSVAPWFTKEKWAGLIDDAVAGLKSNFKLPHFTMSGSFNPINWITEGLPNIGVNWYENGGMPRSGEIFGANENGKSEFIGRIGTKSAVMNNDQIVQAVSSGVANAVVEAFPSQNGGPVVINLNVDGEPLVRKIIRDLKDYERQTGEMII